MFKFIFYFYVLFVFFFWSMFFSSYLYVVGKDFLLEWVVYSVNSIMVEVYVLLDWVSLLFIGFVLLISSMVVLYSIVYMGDDKFLDRFLYLLLLFILSMLLMILSPSLVSILLGWDLLGLVSYCLVIYYQNYSSFNSGMVTVLTNRLGDIGILLSIGISLMYGSWNMYLLDSSVILFSMILLAAITKSAQMPFSSWLPMAMAAPTPISSLVHSSTLVTAGVYLLIRFNNFIMSTKLNFVLLYLSVLTMLMSGVMALYEFDLKKIIALSTLSQLGLMMMVLSMGLKLLGLYHLLTHAIFKSLLFLCAGILIHMVGSQDIRCFGGLSDILPFVSISFFISIMSLMGLPFLSGFYSKDLIMEMLYIKEVNLVMASLIMVSLSLTVWYSLRLYYFLYFNELKLVSVVVGRESLLMNISMMVLMIFSVVVGGLINWLFFFDFCVVFLSDLVKMMTLGFLFMGGLLWLLGVWLSSRMMFYIKLLVLFNSSMWFLNFFYYWMNVFFINFGEYLKLTDSEWVENVSGKFILKVKLSGMKFYYSSYKMYDIIFSQLFMILFVYLIMMC